MTGNGRKTFKFYNKLDEILGHRPASAPTFLVDTGSPSHGTTTAQLQDSDTEGGTDGKGHTFIRHGCYLPQPMLNYRYKQCAGPIFSR